MNHWLTILTLVPFLGGILVAGLGAERKNLVRGLALATSLVALGGAICLWLHFDGKSGELQFVEKFDWVPSLGIQYFLGVDGLGLLMVMLTAIVTPLAILFREHCSRRKTITRTSITRWCCGCKRVCSARSPR